MRQKQKRFQENKLLDALIEPEKPLYTTLKGKWNACFFPTKQPITLEIGCGHGAYTIGLARLFPEHNVIGIDIKGDRLWKGAKEAGATQLTNVAFLRAPVEQLMHFFAPSEVAEIWIPFPDPRPKNRDIKRRLTSPRFLALYQSILTKGGKVHLKTDSALLFSYTLELLQQQGLCLLEQTTDVYAATGSDTAMLQRSIQTAYEKRFLAQGLPIHYLCFSMPE
jgi:tRNA (guanine-N7-)-methyltransferase